LSSGAAAIQAEAGVFVPADKAGESTELGRTQDAPESLAG